MTRPETPRRSLGRERLRRLPLYITVAVITVAAIFPLLWALSTSLSPLETIFEHTYPFSWRALFPTEFTLDAYRTLFEERGFLRPIINTTTLGLITVFLGGLLAAMAGFAFATFEFRFKNVLFGAVLVAFIVPVEATIIIPLFSMMDDIGWVNTWQALLLPGLAQALIVFLFRQFFADIATDLYDAARVDGAGWFRVFFSIVLPISKPVLVAAGLVLFLLVWEQYLWPLVVAPRPEFRMIQVAISLSFTQYQTLWNELMAGSMIAALIPILLILPFQKYYISGLAGTGSKEG